MFNPNFEYLCLKNTNLYERRKSYKFNLACGFERIVCQESQQKNIFKAHFQGKVVFLWLDSFVCLFASLIGKHWFACPLCSVIERSALISSLLTSLVFLGEEQWLLVRKLRNSGQSENLQLPSVSVRKRVLWDPSENSRLLMYNQRTHQPQLLRIAKHCRVKADV